MTLLGSWIFLGHRVRCSAHLKQKWSPLLLFIRARAWCFNPEQLDFCLWVLSCMRGDMSTKTSRVSTETEPDVMTFIAMTGIQFCILEQNTISPSNNNKLTGRELSYFWFSMSAFVFAHCTKKNAHFTNTNYPLSGRQVTEGEKRPTIKGLLESTEKSRRCSSYQPECRGLVDCRQPGACFVDSAS